MRLGLQVPSFTWSKDQGQLGETFGLIAERAERAGLYSLWVMDHFFQISVIGPVENEMLEGWSALAFAAGRTNRIKLGTMVTGVTYRHPGLLVKTATTLDVLSHGRAYFGVGAAWNEEEHRGLGVPFPPLAERFERLEETLQIAQQMWAGDEKPYEGKYYTLARPLNSPQSVQKPHPPLLFGGVGTQMLRLAGRYSDICHIPPWVQVSMEKARSIVKQEARRFHREDKIAFAAGSVANRDQKFELKAIGHDVEKAAKDGAVYYIAALHRTGYLDNLEEFAKSIIPSYSGLD